jgi:hypothetical protein
MCVNGPAPAARRQTGLQSSYSSAGKDDYSLAGARQDAAHREKAEAAMLFSFIFSAVGILTR